MQGKVMVLLNKTLGWAIVLGLMAILIVASGAYAQGAKGAVNLNTASESELAKVKGSDAATAKKIVTNRPYKSVDELTTKAGLAPKTADAIRPHVTVGSAAQAPSTATPAKPAPAESPTKVATPQPAAKVETPKSPAAPAPGKVAPAKPTAGKPVNLNTASMGDLEALPGVGPVKAQAIIDGRPYQKKEDVMKVKGIKGGTFDKIKDLITVQ